MSFLTTNQIRSQFIDYFVKQGHYHAPASPLLPHNDPSLMFVNSGMVQFKNIFTGAEQPKFKTATTAQKCVRAGGKHNDLDNVGYTARHHTFFEMLGNFSFGDYFKESAIYYAWELLNKELGLPKEKLYATVYHTDDEAFNLWKKIAGFSEDKIIRINTNDNFWSMGDTGPCGPCSEIFYDHGDKIPGGLPGTPEQDGDRYIEIWNMVFMQYEMFADGSRTELPKKSIDTGAGLERLTAVLQGVHDNYDIDLFKSLIETSVDLTGAKAEGKNKFSHRVIADHLRSSCFLIADGIMPSNEGRGYVLRRIMRRAMRHIHNLGAKEPVMHKMLPKLIELMGATYPELKRAESFISQTLRQEEERFRATLGRGLNLLEEEVGKLGNKILPGEIAFKLYDTYGFPLDLTQDILKSQNIEVDQKGFDGEMQKQKERARQNWSGSGDAALGTLWFDLKNQFGSTEFLGYASTKSQGTVLALIQDDKQADMVNKSGAKFKLVANQTPFYGESGGQMGDTGIITADTGLEIKVNDTKKVLGLHIHECELVKGIIKKGDNVDLIVDEAHRANLKIHHSATHILHAALREILGSHVTQKGSLVAFDRLRFDFSHNSPITADQIRAIESRCNEIIRQNTEIETNLMDTEQAIEKGAMALFGEKYDSEVRVVSMGKHVDTHFSLELCGGTHASRTGDIGLLKITGESSIAAGIRRIEAVCGQFALEYCQVSEGLLQQLSSILNANKNELLDKATQILESNKNLEKELFKFKKAELSLSKEQIATEARSVGNCKLIVKTLGGVDNKALRTAAEEAITRSDDLVLVYAANDNGKISIIVGCGPEAVKHVKAGDLAKDVSLFLGGNGGGGKPNLAQAGGTNAEKLSELHLFVESLIA